MLSLTVKKNEGILLADANGQPLGFITLEYNRMYISAVPTLKVTHTKHLTIKEMGDALRGIGEKNRVVTEVIDRIVRKELEDERAACQ